MDKRRGTAQLFCAVCGGERHIPWLHKEAEMNIAELFALIEAAEGYWWDGSPDGEFVPLAVEIGKWCVVHREALKEALA